MNKKDILDLMILGRDRIYITLEQIQKAIELTQNAGLTDVVEMLIYKEDALKDDKERATKTIEDFKTEVNK